MGILCRGFLFLALLMPRWKKCEIFPPALPSACSESQPHLIFESDLHLFLISKFLVNFRTFVNRGHKKVIPETKLEEDLGGLSGNSSQLSFSKEFCPLNKHVLVGGAVGREWSCNFRSVSLVKSTLLKLWLVEFWWQFILDLSWIPITLLNYIQ